MRQISRVIIARLGIHFLSERIAHLLLRNMDSGHHDMTGRQLHELEDALTHAGKPYGQWVDNPRIELEALYPYFNEIGEGLAFDSPVEIYKWVTDNVKLDDAANPQGLRIPPVFVWRSRVADSRSRDIFFVALCRRFGFPARIDEVTGKAQYLADAVPVEGRMRIPDHREYGQTVRDIFKAGGHPEIEA